MTEKQMTELLIEILDDCDSKERERKKTNRRVRRKNSIKKYKDRYKIVTETGMTELVMWIMIISIRKIESYITGIISNTPKTAT